MSRHQSFWRGLKSRVRVVAGQRSQPMRSMAGTTVARLSFELYPDIATEVDMSRQSLTAIAIASVVLLAVAIALMGAVMVGAFGGVGHFPHNDFPVAFSPVGWSLMIVAMVLGGLGFLGLVVLLVILLVRAASPRS